MRYEDIVKPSTFADEDYYHELTLGMRRQNHLPCIQAEEYKPFWAISKHSDILEIERQNLIFENTLNSVLETRETEKILEETGPWLKTLIHMD